MNTAEQTRIVAEVEGKGRGKRSHIRNLGIAKSTYYRWRLRLAEPLLPGVIPGQLPWNRLRPDEEAMILTAAREMPTWRSHQVAAWLTDHQDLAVSPSTVYRVLRREGLVKAAEYQPGAEKEYHHKTTGPHQLWATDASYFRVAGWGYYYLVTVMDDYSRYILAWKLQRDMTAESLMDPIQAAIDATGMTDVPIEDRTKLLSDNGSGYVSRAFRDYLRLLGIRHIFAAPYHPQTNGKLERYHRTLKADVNQVPYDVVEDLETAIRDFACFYNEQRYHKALGDVTPVDVLAGRREAILRHRREVQQATLEQRRRYNQGARNAPN